MELDLVTIEDCLIQYEVNQQTVLLNDGHVIGFEEELFLHNIVYFPNL